METSSIISMNWSLKEYRSTPFLNLFRTFQSITTQERITWPALIGSALFLTEVDIQKERVSKRGMNQFVYSLYIQQRKTGHMEEEHGRPAACHSCLRTTQWCCSPWWSTTARAAGFHDYFGNDSYWEENNTPGIISCQARTSRRRATRGTYCGRGRRAEQHLTVQR